MKIAFINPSYGLPVPSTMGGGVEELLTILLKENEKTDGKHKFYFVQKYMYGKDSKYNTLTKYKNSELVLVKYNRVLNFFQRVFNKLLKLCKIKKEYPTFFPTDYHNKVLKAVKKINPDVIIFQSQFDANILKYQKYFGKDKLYLHLHIQNLEKTNLNKFVKGTISVSEFIKLDYENYLGQNNLQNFVLKNCVDETRFNRKITEQEREDLRRQLGFKKDDFLVCYCGRICEEKGVDKLIDAILLTPENIKLLIMGSYSSAKKQITNYIKNIVKTVQKNSQKIKFTGYVKNIDLYKYYQASDLQVVPSMCEEAAGLVVVEGQMSGVPQIITKSGGMVEFASKETIVLERNEKFVDNLSNKIIELSNSKELLDRISCAGYENAKQYNRENYYHNFINIVEQI